MKWELRHVCARASEMRSTKAGDCCPQQQSRWLHHPSHTLAAESETPANGCSRPHDTLGTPGSEEFRLGKNKGPVLKQENQVISYRAELLVCFVGRRFSETPQQTHAHQPSFENLRFPLTQAGLTETFKHQRCHYNKIPVLDRTGKGGKISFLWSLWIQTALVQPGWRSGWILQFSHSLTASLQHIWHIKHTLGRSERRIYVLL